MTRSCSHAHDITARTFWDDMAQAQAARLEVARFLGVDVPAAHTPAPPPQYELAEAVFVAGWATCTYTKKTLALAAELVAAGKIGKLDQSRVFDGRAEYKQWQAGPDGGMSFGNSRAHTHTSAPFVFIADHFIGGNDDFHAWAAKGGGK